MGRKSAGQPAAPDEGRQGNGAGCTLTDTEVELPQSDRYIIRERLGSGGMGVVYAAHDCDRDELIALKTLHHRDPAALYSFKKEFRNLADVAHPNLVSLYELIAESDRWFFTMELIDGVNFIDYLRPTCDQMVRPQQHDESVLTQTLPLDEALVITPPEVGVRPWPNPGQAFEEESLRAALKQLAIGVRALHNAGKIHRDLKPHNVLVTAEGRVVILDFGIARELAPTLSQLTAEAGFLGTLSYMAPEQARGENATPASDWYAVGVMLFEALTGHLPFSGSLSKVMHDKLHSIAPSPADLVKGLPADLVSLCEDLLALEAADRPLALDIVRRLGGTDVLLPDQSHLPIDTARVGVLAGRQEYLMKLEAAFQRTASGHAVCVHVHGTSGMGKTAIVHSFLRRLIESSRAVVLPGRCHARELVPYKALDGVVDSLSKVLLGLPRHEVEILLPRETRALARLFPVLSRVDAIAEMPDKGRGVVDRLPLRRLAFGALRELLARIAEKQPVVIYIDDLQWADADSAALLGDLLRPPDAPALLLITCFRSEEITSQEFLAHMVSLAGSDDCLELSIGPLSDSDATRLARSLLGAHPGLERLIETIVREAHGNPFLIEQLVGYTKATEANLAQTGLDNRVTLAEMMQTRVRGLPPGAEDLLLVLATAGRPIDAAAAYRAAGLEGDERPLVAALRAAHFVRASGSANAIELYHDRIRESLASRISPEETARAHARVAATLIDHGFDDPEALFLHYRNAGATVQAAEQAVLAGRKAFDALAFDRAALFYTRALDLSRSEGENRQNLRRELAECLAHAGRPKGAAASFLELAEQSEGDRALRLRSRAAQEYLAGGYFDQGMAQLRTVFAAVGLAIPERAVGANFSLFWQRALLGLRLAAKGFSFAPRDAETVSWQELLRIDTCYAAAASLATVDPIRGADFQTRQLRYALAAGEPLRIARVLALEASYRASRGTAARRRATRLLNRAAELARLADDPFTTGLWHFHVGLTAYSLGEWRRATDRCDEATSIFTDQCVGAIWEISLARRYGLAAMTAMGEIGEVKHRLPKLIAEADERGNALAAANLRTRFGITWLADDDPEGCRRETAHALSSWGQEGFQVVHFCGLSSEVSADLYEGDGSKAFHRLLDQWPAIARSYVPRIQVSKIEALFLRARCALAAVNDQGRQQALRIARRAAARIAREKLSHGLPTADLIRAACAFHDQEVGAARKHLIRAVDGFEAGEMSLLAAASRRRLGELLGGSSGRTEIEAADAWMTGQQIKRPDRMTGMLAPGFDTAG